MAFYKPIYPCPPDVISFMKKKNPKENSVSLPPLSVTFLLNTFKEVGNQSKSSPALFTFLPPECFCL